MQDHVLPYCFQENSLTGRKYLIPSLLQELEDGERVVGGPCAAAERERAVRRVRGEAPGTAGDKGKGSSRIQWTVG